MISYLKFSSKFQRQWKRVNEINNKKLPAKHVYVVSSNEKHNQRGESERHVVRHYITPLSFD